MKIKSLLLQLYLLAFLTSCSNDNGSIESNQDANQVTFVEENPLPNYLNVTQYNEQTTVFTNIAVEKEIGYFFEPLRKGKINSLVVKLPTVETNLEVRIWDLVTHTVVRTEIVNVNIANSTIVKDIVPLELVKNRNYAITMITNNYYAKSKIDFGVINHPVTIGNFKIYGSYLSNCDPFNPSFNTLIGLYNGDCSFNFLPTE
jgi:PBP1b-binding outer membrane lipoprotein LpoB